MAERDAKDCSVASNVGGGIHRCNLRIPSRCSVFRFWLTCASCGFHLLRGMEDSCPKGLLRSARGEGSRNMEVIFWGTFVRCTFQSCELFLPSSPMPGHLWGPAILLDFCKLFPKQPQKMDTSSRRSTLFPSELRPHPASSLHELENSQGLWSGVRWRTATFFHFSKAMRNISQSFSPH
jgi:hypothetical protein